MQTSFAAALADAEHQLEDLDCFYHNESRQVFGEIGLSSPCNHSAASTICASAAVSGRINKASLALQLGQNCNKPAPILICCAEPLEMHAEMAAEAESK